MNVYTSYLPSPARAFQIRIRVAERAFESVCYVYTLPLGAVEGARQVLALISDAVVLLGVLLVDAVACLVGGASAFREE